MEKRIPKTGLEIMVVDDSQEAIQGMKSILLDWPGLYLSILTGRFNEASSGREIADKIYEAKPDIVLLDEDLGYYPGSVDPRDTPCKICGKYIKLRLDNWEFAGVVVSTSVINPAWAEGNSFAKKEELTWKPPAPTTLDEFIAFVNRAIELAEAR